MTRDEAHKILDKYRRWNTSQKSVSHAFGGPRSDEDDIYDARRELILKATQRLAEDETP